MHRGRLLWTGLVVAAVGVSGVLISAQQQPAPKAQPKVVREAARPIQSIEGKDLYAAYCASCHGKALKGDGPAAPALKAAPPDLTTIAKRSGGKYEWVQVEQMIQGSGRQFAAHGSSDMPVWGHIFYSMGGDDALATMRVKNLTKYIESLQQP
jgi:mono/diheme cytochrome c family protein